MKEVARFLRNVLSKDENRKLHALSCFGRFLFPAYRFCWPQLDWWKNEIFNSYLSRFDELEEYNTQRKWMLHQLLRLTSNVPSDTAECGVFLGASSFLICESNRIGTIKRTHHCFDSFQGLSEPSSIDGKHWIKGNLGISEGIVKDNLACFDNVKYYKGWIPERFSEVEGCEFRFVHIDVDLYDPTKDSVEYFYPRMSENSILLCDDYGFDTCPGATKAIDDFLLDKPEKMIALDSGGGFFIRGVKTAVDTTRFGKGFL